MERAWIDGSPVALDAAIAEAARLLGASRLPVFAGLDCDVAGAREAIALAWRLGGVCDQSKWGNPLRTLDAMREAGAILTTPNEARLRADMLLMIGSSMGVDWPDLAERLMSPFGPEADAKQRRMVWLCSDDRQRTGDTAPRYGRVIGRSNSELPALLAALRARVAGRPVQQATTRASSGKPGPGRRGRAKNAYEFPLARERLVEVDALAAELKSAKFGVALWATQDLDALATEMAFGLIDDLNAHTRFAGASLAPGRTGWGVTETCGWLTGFPCPVGFGRGVPEHDPWRFDTDRLVESGEADCVVCVSLLVPSWERSVPLIMIGYRPSVDPARASARVYIEVGHPGIDHDGLLHSMWTGTIAPAAALRPSDVPSVADVLARLAAALPESQAKTRTQPVPFPLAGEG
jgi:formylmethanofuran dehydrogenase subunit B